jgi:hypothetical protein
VVLVLGINRLGFVKNNLWKDDPENELNTAVYEGDMVREASERRVNHSVNCAGS